MALAMLVHIWKSLPFWTLILMAGRLAIPKELYEAASVDGATRLAEVQVRHLAVDAHALSHLAPSCRLIWTLGDFNSVYLLTGGRPGGHDARAGDARHPLHPPRPGRPCDGDDRGARCRSCCRWSTS